MRASPRSGVSAAMACSWRLHRRVLPAAGGRDFRVDLVWPPGAWLVFVDGGGVLQHRIDDSPRLFDVVLPSEQRRSEEHTSELQSQSNLVCRLLLEKKKQHAR